MIDGQGGRRGGKAVRSYRAEGGTSTIAVNRAEGCVIPGMIYVEITF